MFAFHKIGRFKRAMGNAINCIGVCFKSEGLAHGADGLGKPFRLKSSANFSRWALPITTFLKPFRLEVHCLQFWLR